jgi:hypothetical protein
MSYRRGDYRLDEAGECERASCARWLCIEDWLSHCYTVVESGRTEWGLPCGRFAAYRTSLRNIFHLDLVAPAIGTPIGVRILLNENQIPRASEQGGWRHRIQTSYRPCSPPCFPSIVWAVSRTTSGRHTPARLLLSIFTPLR